MGEKQATVVLQLMQPTVISAIDIGNAHSAFVEILVGKSSAANDNFQVSFALQPYFLYLIIFIHICNLT